MQSPAPSKSFLEQMEEGIPRTTPEPSKLAKCRNLQLNDIVLIKDIKLPRCSWSLGRVMETEADKTNLVRAATVKAKEGFFEDPSLNCSLSYWYLVMIRIEMNTQFVLWHFFVCKYK